jgi:Sec7-like guanine-nucleotide exchange factor
MKNRLFKADMAKAAAKFTRKDKDGIKYLIEKGYVPKEPGEAQVKAVTKFLKTTPSVGPTAIGVFFGGTN